MRKQAYDPKNCLKSQFMPSIAMNIALKVQYGVNPEPLLQSGGPVEKLTFYEKETLEINPCIDAPRSQLWSQAAKDPTHDNYSPSGTYGQSSV